MKKRIWMIIFALAMVMTCVSVTAAASEVSEPVASVTTTEGVTEYTALADALAAASAAEGAVVKLLRDSQEMLHLTVSEGKFTLDLNGHLWSCGNGVLLLEGTADVTLIDSVGGGIIRCSADSPIRMVDSAKLEIAGGTVDGGNFSSVDMSDYGNLTEAELTVSGGSLITNGLTAIQASGCLVRITGGELGGDIRYDNGVLDLSAHGDPNEIVVKTSPSLTVFDVSLPDGYLLYDAMYHTAALTLAPGTEYYVGALQTDTAVASVKIGESVVPYTLLVDAITAASMSEGGEVTLLRDVTTDQSIYPYDNGMVTLDLNGKTWTANCTALYLVERAQVKIVDRSPEGNGRITGTQGQTILVFDSSKLEVAGGTVEHIAGVSAISTSPVYSVTHDSELIVSGGTVRSAGGDAIAVGCRKTVVNGSSVESGIAYMSGALTLTGDPTDVEIQIYHQVDLTNLANVITMPEGYAFYRSNTLLPCQLEAGKTYRIRPQLNPDDLALRIRFNEDSTAYDAASNTFSVSPSDSLKLTVEGVDTALYGDTLTLFLVNSLSYDIRCATGDVTDGKVSFELDINTLTNYLNLIENSYKKRDVVALAVIHDDNGTDELLALLELNVVEWEGVDAAASVEVEGERIRYFTELADAIAYVAEKEGAVVTLMDSLWVGEPISVGQGTFTIELDGNEWYGEKGALSLHGTAQVTISDSTGSGTVFTSEGAPITISLTGGATLTVESGDIAHFYPEGIGVALLDDGGAASPTLVIQNGSIDGIISLEKGTVDLTARDDPSHAGIKFMTEAAATGDGLLLPDGYTLYDQFYQTVDDLTVDTLYLVYSETVPRPVIESVTFDTDSPFYDAETNTFAVSEDPPLIFTLQGTNTGEIVNLYECRLFNSQGHFTAIRMVVKSDTEITVLLDRKGLESFLNRLAASGLETDVVGLEIVSLVTGQTYKTVPLRMVPDTENVASVTAGGVTVYHLSFGDAIADAAQKEDAVVKILRDLSWIQYKRIENASFTLDLNGKSLHGQILFAGGSDIRIIDSATGGKLLYGDGENATLEVNYGGKLELGGGTVGRMYVYSDGEITVSGGTVSYIYNAGVTKILGGKVDQVHNIGTLTVSGGTVDTLNYFNGEIDLSSHSDPTGFVIYNGVGTPITAGDGIKLPDGYGFYDMSNHPLTTLKGGEKARIYLTSSAPAPKNPVIEDVLINSDSPAYDAATRTFYISRGRPLIVTIRGRDLMGLGENIMVGLLCEDNYYLDTAFVIDSDTEINATITYDFLVRTRKSFRDYNVSDIIKGFTVRTETASYADIYSLHIREREPVEITPVFGGTVTVSDPLAEAGDTVTVTLTHKDCYLPGTFTVADEDGNSVPVSGNSFVMPQSSVTIEVTFTANHTGTISEGVYTCCGDFDPAAIKDGVYQIGTPEMLAAFAKRVGEGHTDLDAVLTADIDLSSLENVMIGTEANPYGGSFDGRGKRVSVNMISDEDYTALFRYVKNARIENLTVDGTVTTSAKFAAGLIGQSVGNVTVKKVISDVTILSSVEGDGTHGGLVANNAGGTLNILYSAFVGKIAGSGTNACAGMVGWTHDAALTILTDCFVAADFETDTEGCHPFGRNSGKVIVDNCYYVTAYGETPAYGVQITDGQLTSGEVTFLLNRGETDGTQHWYQSCGEGLPTHSGSTVYYGYLSCAESAVAVYTNDPSAASEQSAHIPAEDDGNCTTDIHCTVCGEVTEEGRASHTGGKATCKTKAKCKICGKRYGSLAKHTPAEDDGDCTTDILCTVCDKVITEGADDHTGGTVTCKSLAQCTLCGKEYGELAAHTPAEDDGDCTTDVLCTVCGEVTAKGADAHTGGKATCKDKAKCALCGKEYGELAAHTPAADDGDCTTDIHCTVCGEVTAKGADAHTGGKATCKDKAKCALCGKEYGSLTAHTPAADDGDCTTDILCSVCGEVTAKGADAHTGGKATCKDKAKCEACGKEYGEFASHNDADGDGACDVCQTTMGAAPTTPTEPTTPSETTDMETDPVTSDDEKDGDAKSGTAPALIITVSVIALAAGGGFGVYWFVIRKRIG